MHKQGVLTANFNSHLANRFEERQGFDITYSTADFDQYYVMTFAAFQHTLFDSVCDVRNNLYGCAEVVAAAFFTQNVRVDTTRGEVVAAAHFGTNETLVVPQVQGRFQRRLQ